MHANLLARHAQLFGLMTLSATLMAGGCRSVDAPRDLADAADDHTASTDDAVKPPPELFLDAWTKAAVPGADADSSGYRWQHAPLAKLTQSATEPLDFSPFADNGNPVVSANAAIMQARAGDSGVFLQLIDAVRDADLKLPLRNAATEALARLDATLAVPSLTSLIDEFDDPDAAGYSPELHLELLEGLARHVEANATQYFVKALADRSATIRIEAIRALEANHEELPQRVVDLRRDRDPHVRAAALLCLARRHHPDALDFAQTALADLHLDVRLAAVAALGEVGGDEAQRALARLVARDSEAVRAAAVGALAAAGDDVTVFASAGDTAWQVRTSVGRALARFPTERGVAIARQLLADRNAEVRSAVVESLAQWPLEQAGPVLLAAMAEAPTPTRKQASEQLGRRWPPAASFSGDGPNDYRRQRITELEQAWAATHAPTPR
ncbi:MAG: HEAT repeat domain-containing protein [Planctomycetia bacterium]|nr:HEAT repeat domain-containing protein [Planctomycetia bacterium]